MLWCVNGGVRVCRCVCVVVSVCGGVCVVVCEWWCACVVVCGVLSNLNIVKHTLQIGCPYDLLLAPCGALYAPFQVM